MGAQEGAWPKGKLRSETIDDWLANEERRKELSCVVQANPSNARGPCLYEARSFAVLIDHISR